ncbi:hypothetical protein LAZ67_18000937 [Cordylochernes scorpioides]|uniref:Retrotransposon gag domain-containing protein n=1 Tax=Cordylochernes scorpioides TaxID=51811 RepID=A0ABY6LFF3_9ARAC|nr:hypothetical protein LAZ67_18000937 [Cordylochernes scorpioides]
MKWGECHYPLVSHISEFPVHGCRSGSGLTRSPPYFTLQGSPLLVLLLPPATQRRVGLLEKIWLIICKFLLHFSEAQNNDYKLVVSKFQDYFIGKRNIIYERAKFNRRSQGESKPVKEFITNLYVLAENCNYGILKEEMIRYRLVVGELTLEKAIQIVRQSENKKRGRNDTFFQKTRMKETKTYNSNFPKNHQGWSSNEKHKCFRCGYYQGHLKE